MTRLFSTVSCYLPGAGDEQRGAVGQENREAEASGLCNDLPLGMTKSEASQLLSRKDSLLDAAWQLLEDENWKLVHDKLQVRVLSQKSRYRSGGSAWRLETVVNLPADRMFLEMWDRVEQQTDWYSNMSMSKIVARLSADVTILHNGTVDTAGGLVKARDFVTLCVRGRRSGVPFTGGASIESGLVPPMKRYVRGENYPGCIACIPLSAFSCKLVWIMDSDIKGWIPTSVVDQAMTNSVSHLGISIQKLASKIVLAEKRTVSIEDNANSVS